jgi:Pregnancy-associated plasma protein-A
MAHPNKRTCAAMSHHAFLAKTDEVYRDNRRQIERFAGAARLAPRTNVITIPVVVHVLFHDDSENLSQEQIQSQIDALNRDYRSKNDPSLIPPPFRTTNVDPLLEFALAVRDPAGKPTTGVTRKRTTITQFPYDSFDDRATEKLDKLVKSDEHGRAAWPRDDYLNLWTCSIGGGLLGYAQFPGGPAATDGVVILNTAFGTVGTAADPANKFNLGRTAVHEVGHWLNLLHIWGDDDQGCTGSDNVEDTPNQSGSNSGTPLFPHISCGNDPDGDMFMNYMDYVDDAAMFMFTKGQADRIESTLAGPRQDIVRSDKLKPVQSERLALTFPAGAPAASKASREAGQPVQRWFDGVSWVTLK